MPISLLALYALIPLYLHVSSYNNWDRAIQLLAIIIGIFLIDFFVLVVPVIVKVIRVKKKMPRSLTTEEKIKAGWKRISN
jgi:hypothetical protein